MNKMLDNVKKLNKYGMVLVNFVENSGFMQLGDFYRIEFNEDKQYSTKYYSLNIDIINSFTEKDYFIDIKALDNDNFSFVLTNCTDMWEHYFENFNDMLQELTNIDKKEYEEFNF